jgi:AcrR family transcriptional regulator
MIHVAARDGYTAATIAQVIAHAGVSRPTFYDYFVDKDDCFLTALADVHRPLLADIRDAVAQRPPQDALKATIGTLVEFAGAQPASARLLMSELMAAGPRALDARDEGIAEIGEIVSEAYEQLTPDAAIPDFSPRMVIGGIYRLLSSRLRQGALIGAALTDDLLGWISCYEQPLREHRWRTLTPVPALAPSPFLPPTPLRAPPSLPPGRTRLSKEEMAENRRLRIMFATAQVVQEKGYSAATVADIMRLAGVDRRAFGALFADKQEAFIAVYELGFQRLVAVTASAFASGATWPERIWEGGRAFTQFLQSNPSITHVGFVDSYAVGPGSMERVEDLTNAFTIFLQEGYRYQPQRNPPSSVGAEAIVTTTFEIIYHQSRASANPELPGLLPHVVYLITTPFLA